MFTLIKVGAMEQAAGSCEQQFLQQPRMNSYLAAPASEEETPRAPSPKRHVDGTPKGPPNAIVDQARAGPKPRLREPMHAKIPENQRAHRPNTLPEHRQNRSPAPTHHHERTHKKRAVGALATQRSAAQRSAAQRCAALRSLACCTALHAHRATHPRACAATRRYAKTRDPNPGPPARKTTARPLDHM